MRSILILTLIMTVTCASAQSDQSEKERLDALEKRVSALELQVLRDRVDAETASLSKRALKLRASIDDGSGRTNPDDTDTTPGLTDQELLEVLRQRKWEASSACEVNKTFCVKTFELRSVPDSFGGKDYRIHIEVFNGTKRPIARADFEATLFRKSRGVPYGVSRFSAPFSGGLEPGEDQMIVIQPRWGADFGGDLGNAERALDDGVDLGLDISPEEIVDDAGDKVDFVRFTQSEARKMRSLERKVEGTKQVGGSK